MGQYGHDLILTAMAQKRVVQDNPFILPESIPVSIETLGFVPPGLHGVLCGANMTPEPQTYM